MMLGERVRAARRAQGMTVAALAEACGLTKGFISQFERGLSNPSLDSLRCIARTLDVSLTTLLTDDGGHSLLESARQETPTLLPKADWKDRTRGLIPLLPGHYPHVMAQIPPGGRLSGGSAAAAGSMRRLFCFVVEGEVVFTQEATEVTLGTGDALSWNGASGFGIENRGISRASLLVSGPEVERLRLEDPARLRAGSYPPVSSDFDPEGPLRLVAMRAQRQGHGQGRKGG